MLAIKPDHFQVLEDIEVLHLHGVWDPILSCVAAAARHRGIPYVVAPQGMLDPWSLRQKAIKKQLALMLHYRRMLEKAAFVQALHDDECHFAKAVAPRCRVEILPNGVCLEEISLSHQSDGGVDYFESRFQWPGSKTVLFLGRLHHKKGLDVLGEAFALLVQRHTDARLVVAGPDEGAKVSFERQIDELGIASKVWRCLDLSTEMRGIPHFALLHALRYRAARKASALQCSRHWHVKRLSLSRRPATFRTSKPRLQETSPNRQPSMLPLSRSTSNILTFAGNRAKRVGGSSRLDLNGRGLPVRQLSFTRDMSSLSFVDRQAHVQIFRLTLANAAIVPEGRAGPSGHSHESGLRSLRAIEENVFFADRDANRWGLRNDSSVVHSDCRERLRVTIEVF